MMATSQAVPFNEHLQIASMISDNASAQAGEFHLRWRPEYANSSGNYHGGALMAVSDAAMSRALHAQLVHGEHVATIQMSSAFVSAGAGDVIIVVDMVKTGRRIAHCNASISTTTGKLLFTATALFAITIAT